MGNAYFEFDEQGYPYAVKCRAITKQTLGALLPAALATPYEPKLVSYKDPESGKWNHTNEILDTELRFRNSDGTWMSKAEVGAIRLAEAYSNGEDKAVNQILDRILGKPKQEMEVVQTKLTFQDWLKAKQMAEAEKAKVTVQEAKRNAIHAQPASIATAPAIVTVADADAIVIDRCDWL